MNDARRRKKVSADARPHPGLLPRGEGTALARLDFSVDCSANPVAGFSRSRRAFPLLLGEKAGMREIVESNYFRHRARTVGGTIQFGKWFAVRRKRQPGRARSPAKSQLVAVRKHRPMAVWGGRTGQRVFEFLLREGCEGGEVAERRNDNSPAIHGWVKRQQNESPARDGRRILSSLAGLWMMAGNESQP